MRYKNLSLLGTSHIARESVEAVNKCINEQPPGIIALELDKGRLAALGSRTKSLGIRDLWRIGLKGFLFGMLGAWAERKLGEVVHVKPGTEMLTAIKLAKKQGIPLALIDQPIEVTLRRLSKTLTWKERFRFLWDLLKAGITRKPEITFDLSKVPDQKIIETLLHKVKAAYPNVYRVLITERNDIMGKNLAHLMKQYPDKQILAIVGAGHEEALITIVQTYLKQVPKKE